VSRYQKGNTNLDFTEATDSEWQWHRLGHMQVAPRSRQTTTPAPTTPILQAGCPSCRPTNSVKAQMTFDLCLLVHLDTVLIKVEGQGYKEETRLLLWWVQPQVRAFWFAVVVCCQ